MIVEEFVGRDAEARAILANTELRRSSLIIGDAGMGKSALIEFIAPILESEGRLISISKIGPGFTSFLKELFHGLWEHGIVQISNDFTESYKTWAKQYKGNDEKSAALLKLCEQAQNIILTVDDASGISSGTRPWLIKFVECCTVIAAIDPLSLRKTGTKRFWKLFDEIRLGPLNKAESADLLDKLIKHYAITADDMDIYKRSVLDMAQGSPFELNRLVKYHSSETLVKSREIISGTSSFVERDVRQLALAPILLIIGAFAVAGRYIARVQDDMDFYVLSAIGLGLLILFTPLIKAALKPKSK